MKYMLFVIVMVVIAFTFGKYYGESMEQKRIQSRQIQDDAYKIFKHASIFDDSVGYMHDYQLEYFNDTLWLFADTALLGKHLDSNGIHGAWIDSMILQDNGEGITPYPY